MIGIRSARLHADGAAVTLRAGVGHRRRLRPEAEAAETDVKLATVLEAVVPGALSAAAVSGTGLGLGGLPPRRGWRRSGILTTSVAPAPGVGSTSAVPRSASAMARTMASPSPVPEAERDGSPW